MGRLPGLSGLPAKSSRFPESVTEQPKVKKKIAKEAVHMEPEKKIMVQDTHKGCQWNSLTLPVMSSPSTEVCKGRLEYHLSEKSSSKPETI